MLEKELYPFATLDGKAIPLDILRPVKVLIAQFTAAAYIQYVLEVTDKVAIITASEEAMLVFAAIPDPIVAGSVVSDALFLPKNVSVVTSLVAPLTMQFKGISAAGTAYVQVIEKWAGLALDKQTRIKG